MPRYRRQPASPPSAPGLFDDLDREEAMARRADRESQSPRVTLSGGIRPAPFTPAGHPDVDPLVAAPADCRLRFMSFGSGSSGNCAFIGDDKGGFLIDAGVDLQRVVTELNRNGISFDNIHGIILTHDHGDHVRYAYTLLRKHRFMRLYCTPRALNGLLRRHSISRRIKDYHEPIHKEFAFHIGDFKITPFEVSHDGTDNAGFFIEYGHHRFAVATDLGVVGERARHYMSQANYMMIEANYDTEMLIRGRYPNYLKARIMADNGHLDNIDTARFVAEVAAGGSLKHVFLCHLSNDNNTPDIAVSTVTKALVERGLSVGDCSGSIAARDADVQVMALPRFEATQLFIFR